MGEPFKPLKVEEWLVSKRYFLSAAKAWIGNQEFDAKSAQHSLLYHNPYSARNGSGLFREFCAFLTVDYVFMTAGSICHSIGINIGACRKLKDLTLQIGHDVFAAVKGKYPFEVAFEDAELQYLARRLGLHKVRGLRSLRLQPCEERFAKTEAKRKVFAENVQRLEHIAWTCRSVEPREPIEVDRVLYCGSRVKTSCPDVKTPGSKEKRRAIMQYMQKAYRSKLDFSTSSRAATRRIWTKTMSTPLLQP